MDWCELSSVFIFVKYIVQAGRLWYSVSDMHNLIICTLHDDVIKWKHFPRYWSFVLGIHRSPVNSPHKGQWRGALMFSLICTWINGQVNIREAGDLRRYRTHHDVTVMTKRHVWAIRSNKLCYIVLYIIYKQNKITSLRRNPLISGYLISYCGECPINCFI